MTKKEIRRKWVAALRSGEYEQGRFSLRTSDNKYCCLGVLCEVAVKERKIPRPVAKKEVYEFSGNTGHLPSNVMHWVGLRTSSGEYYEGRKLTGLTAENDWNGKDFNQIADIIESEPEGLFVKETDEDTN